MKKITNQFNGSHADRINNGGGRFRRIALFPLMLFMLLLVPTSMVAQTDYDNTVTFTALAGNPQGFTNETYAKLFDGKKTEDNFSKWCCKFSGSANVIFAASKAGVPVGYTITTGNDNFTSKGRNPMSWKLYGNNVGKDGEWTLIQEVNNDTKLQDVNYTSYDFTCGGGKSYKYFKWEISAIHSGDVLQVGEFELKLQTCTHTNADGSSALGNAIKTVETTCTEHGYTTYKCSICHSTVKEYKTDELKKHTLTYHEAKDGVKEHWQCDVCHKYFSDADATQEVSYASLLYPAYAVFEGSTGTLTFKCSPSKPEGAYDLNVGFETPGWFYQRNKIKKVVFDASFANARPTSCFSWFRGCENLTTIEGIEYLNTENVENMSFMFRDCYALESLALSSFNTAKVTSMSHMFYICKALTTIYASDKFVTDQVTYGNNMFYGCEKLKDYDGSKTNYKYANYKTGYFSKLVGKNGNEKIGASGETLTAASLALDDDKDFVAYEPFTATTATYNREMKEGTTWATLCLPFEVSLADKNFRAFKLLSVDERTNTIEFEEVNTTIPAGTPVFIKMNEGANSLSFSVADKEIANEVKTGATADGYQLVGLYATKMFDNDQDSNCYILKAGKLMNPAKILSETSTEAVGSKPFRAYMVDNNSSASGAKMFSISENGSNPTGIDQLTDTLNDSNAAYYDLQGHRLSQPQKGINILKVGNKTMKVIIK